MDSLKVFVVFSAICAASVIGKPYSLDVFENRDVLQDKKSDLVKRTTAIGGSNDIAELSIPKISLSAFIDNIESGLVQTALSAGSVASDSSAQVPAVTAHPTVKRSTENQDAASDPIVLVQTTEKVPAADAVPSHVVIDRVSVFKAPASGAVLFPTFHFQETIKSAESGEVLSEVHEDQYVVEASTTEKDSSESSESEEDDKSSEEKSSTSTTESTYTVESSSPSSSSTPSTTTEVVNEKKTVEKELKEKVAEVEAEPVILTARV